VTAIRWTPEAIIAAFQQWADEHGRTPTKDDWRAARDGRYPCDNTVRRVFGSWSAGRSAAGLEFTPRWGRTWTRETIIAAFRQWAEKHGRAPSVDDWRTGEYGRPSAETVQRLFGSWTAGRDAAGLTFRPVNHAGDWSREDIVDAIFRWVYLHGRPPTRRDWLAGPEGFPSVHRVVSVFGQWNGAILSAGYRPNKRMHTDHAYRAFSASITKRAA
jgi:hypothetical protein